MTTVDQVRRQLVEALGTAFRAFTTQAQSQREDLYALTMSGLGGCTRQAAYRLARATPSEDMVFTEARAANIGTMIHAGLLPHLAAVLEGTDEIPVTLKTDTLTINGRSDLYTPALRLVADLKTVGQHRMGSVGPGATHPHRLQVGGYALAVEQSGQPVEWIAWLYLDRSSGEDRIVVEEFTDEVRDLITRRCAELAVYGENPEAAPRDERGPGLSIVCDQCPWLRRCWGEDAAPGRIGAQRVLCHDNHDVERALDRYKEASEREREATDQKEFYRAMFSGFDPGAYGEWQFGWSSLGETDDKDAAVDMLKAAGLPVPRKTTGRRLVVRRTRPPQDQ